MDNMESMRKFSGEMAQRGGHISVTISHDGQTSEHDLESMIMVGIDYGSQSVDMNKSTCVIKGEATGKLNGVSAWHMAEGLRNMLAHRKLKEVAKHVGITIWLSSLLRRVRNNGAAAANRNKRTEGEGI